MSRMWAKTVYNRVRDELSQKNIVRPTLYFGDVQF